MKDFQTGRVNYCGGFKWCRKGMFLLPFVLVFSLSGQVPVLKMKYFTREDGLASVQVNQITQDSTGYIWLATRNGLYRYDGYGFRGYQHQQKDSTSLPSSSVNCIYCDSSGVLWAGTNMGICRYNSSGDNFTTITSFSEYSSLTGTGIYRISQNNEGQLLFSSGRYIFILDRGTERVRPLVKSNNGDIGAFLCSEGTLWIGLTAGGGLSAVRPDPSDTTLIIPGPGEFLPGNSISDLDVLDGRLWIATLGQGIKNMDINNHQLQSYPCLNNDECMAVSVYGDKLGRIWTVDYTGLKYLDQQNGTLHPYYPLANSPYSVKGGVNGIFMDKQGNLWLSHSPGGAGIAMNLKGFRSYTDNPLEVWSLPGNNITAIGQDRHGNLWMGSAEGGVTVFDREKGTPVTYLHDETDPYSIGRGSVLNIFRDSRGTMWLGSYFGGLQYFEEKTGHFRAFTHNPEDPSSIACNDVRGMAEDQQGRLWLAVHGKGIDRLDTKTGKFEHFTNSSSNLSNDWTYKLLVDHRGDLWAATAWGLSHLSLNDSLFTFFYQASSDTIGLVSSEITSLYEDHRNQLWVGTASGIHRFDPLSAIFEKIPISTEPEYISGIIAVDDSILWISSRNGLFSYNELTGEVRQFNSCDGLESDEYNLGALLTDIEGTLYFGGTKGVDYFKPSFLNFNSTPPHIIIDDISIYNRNQSLVDPVKSWSPSGSGVRSISIPYRYNYITIGFKALNYINPDKNRYRYRLEGLENTWKDAGTITEAYYPHLEPGKYIFRVQACNNDGVWNLAGSSISVTILSPWYNSLYFKLFIILALLASAYGYSNIRIKKLRKRQLLLEKAIREKTSELTRQNRKLDQANSLLTERQELLEEQSEELRNQSENLVQANQELEKLNATKDKLFSIIAHDLSNPFNTIIGFSNLLESDYDRLDDDEKRNFINIVNTSSTKVYNLLQHLLLWARTQTNRIQYNPENLPLQTLIDETIRLASESAGEKEITLQNTTADHLSVWADPNLVRVILRNLVNNGIKFTPRGGIVQVTTECGSESCRISISDNGTGMDEQQVSDLLSNELITPTRGTDGEAGNGLGVSLCREFIRINKGELDISSRKGEGSTFSFTLPLKES